MTKKDLAKARGLNSLADPSSFKGSPGRARLTKVADPEPTNPPPMVERQPNEPTRLPADPTPPSPPLGSPPISHGVTALDDHRPIETAPPTPAPNSSNNGRRKRRELSVPLELAEAVERTGVNPADVVLAGLRHYGDSIYAGKGARMAARGRKRLRISVSDSEFDQITRLGEYRGWNRSETVGVILSMELFGRLTYPTPLTENSTDADR